MNELAERARSVRGIGRQVALKGRVEGPECNARHPTCSRATPLGSSATAPKGHKARPDDPHEFPLKRSRHGRVVAAPGPVATVEEGVDDGQEPLFGAEGERVGKVSDDSLDESNRASVLGP